MMPRAWLAPLACAALVGAGCGGGGEAGGVETEGGETRNAAIGSAAEIAAPEPATGARLEVVDSRFGRVVADRHGEALYLFDRERGGESECYGACAEAWPPLLTKGRPVAAGVSPEKLGTTRRSDGRLQVTYAGHPLYYYVADSPGTILCHDVFEFGGTWLVVTPQGHPAA